MTELPKVLVLVGLFVAAATFLVALARSQEALEALRHEAKLYGELNGFWWDTPSTEAGQRQRKKLHRAVGLALACFLMLGILIGLSHVVY